MGEFRSFFSFTATRPVAITMLVVAALVFGMISYGRLPTNLLPEIAHPKVTIRTEYPGASPQDVEERVSERIQESVSVISGVQRVLSISRPEVSDVILEFAWGTKMVFAVSDIRERLDRVYLPSTAKRPLVLRYDPSLDPVLTLGLSGEQSLVELRRMAEEEMERELSELAGVAAVKVRGGEEEEIRIAVDEKALSLYGLDIKVIGERLFAENLNSASGIVEEGKTEYLVRALNEFKSLEEIRDVILERRGEISLRLKDVASVERVPKDREVISRVDGRPCVLLDVYREAGANIVQICEQIRQRVFGTQQQQTYVQQGKHLEKEEPRAETAVEAEGAEKKGAREEKLRRFRKARERRQMTDYLAYQIKPYGAKIELLQDQSRFIRNSIDDVLDSALVGGFFAILVIYLFLRRFGPTGILFVSIPISLIATFAPMFMTDIDLNIMSLGGLALGVGMLVDNSIVVLESIARAREEGLPRRRAGVEGVSRVSSAVIASTLTTIAVFFPIVFVEGVAGQLFRDQALTVVYALLLSLLVALFVIPMLATRGKEEDRPLELETMWRRYRFGLPLLPVLLPGLALTICCMPFFLTRSRWQEGGPPPEPGSWIGRFLGGIASFHLGTAALLVMLLGRVIRILLWPLVALFDAAYAEISRGYPGLLGAALAHRAAVLLLALLLLAGAFWRSSYLGSEVLPEVHQGEFYLDAFLPRDATVERTDAVMQRIEKEIRAHKEVESTFLASGVDKQELNDSDQGEHSSRVLVTLKAAEDRLAQEESVRDVIREIVRRSPAVQSYRFARPSVLSFNAPITVEVLGRDLIELRKACEEVVAAMQRVDGLRDVRSSLQRGNTEISIRLDRDKMAALGLDSRVVTRMVQNKVQGDVPTLFAERERKIDILVRLDQTRLRTMTQLLDLNVNPKGNPPMPLGSLATLQRKEGPSEIRRLDNLRGAEVQATLAGLDLGSTQEQLEAQLAGLSLPRGVAIRLGRQKQELEQSLNGLTMALLLAIFLVYVVMASQFESLVQPFVILMTLPLAMVGVVFVLEWLGIPLSVVVFLGAIVLAGIVVNNAIILIDQINRLRAAGRPKLEAIIEGATIRLRPVLMTTATTVLGLLPLTGWLSFLALPGSAEDWPGIGWLPGFWNLLFASGTEGLELRAPMAITVITGLTVSTLLTLVVIPVVYSLADRRS